MNTQTQALSVQLVVQSEEVKETLTSIINELDQFTLLTESNVEWVDVLVLEIGANPDSEFETIRALLNEDVVGSLFLTSAVTSSEILLPALRAGAKEFFPQPIDPDEVKAAFAKILFEAAKNNSDNGNEHKTETGKIYSVLGAKGGVGTTTFAVNFATSLQAQNKDKLVALVDMNRLVGEVLLFLDLESDTNWEEIGKNFSRLDASYLQTAMTKHESGIFVLPAPGRLDKEALLPDGFLFHLLKAMRHFFDYIVVDSGMYFDETSFNIFSESEKIYLVTILSLPCIINVRKLQESILLPGGIQKEKLNIIANRFEKKSQVSLTEANKIIGSDISETIPNNYSLAMSAINNGKTVADVGKNSDLAKAYRKLAQSVITPEEKKATGFFSWFK